MRAYIMKYMHRAISSKEKYFEWANIYAGLYLVGRGVLQHWEEVAATVEDEQQRSGPIAHQTVLRWEKERLPLYLSIYLYIGFTSKSAWAGPREEMFSFRIELNSCANISAAAPGGALQMGTMKG